MINKDLDKLLELKPIARDTSQRQVRTFKPAVVQKMRELARKRKKNENGQIRENKSDK